MQSRIYPCHLTIAALLLGVCLGCEPLGPPTTLHLEPGDDLQQAVDQMAEGGEIILADGVYEQATMLHITKAGITLRAENSRAATILAAKNFQVNPKSNKGRMIRVDSPDVTLKGLTLKGQFQPLVKAVEAADRDEEENVAHRLLIDDCEVFHFSHHAIDIDSDDSIVRDCSIYENLFGSNDERHDAHGVVTTNAQRLLIEGCEIYSCSGDCIQGERGIWSDLRIERCHLYDQPLAEPLGGFDQGTFVSENAFDSKRIWGGRNRVALVDCNIHGFRSKLIRNTAALNLKEGIDVVVDRCEVYDSEIAFRLRGHSKGMKMWPVVMNCVVRGNDFAFRLEDRLQKFRLLHCTMIDNKEPTKWAPGGGPWKGNWDNSEWVIANNLWIEPSREPEIATDSKLGASNNKFVKRAQVDDALVPRTAMPGAPAPAVVYTWYVESGRVEKDKQGKMRAAEPTVGALEFSPAKN